MELASPSGMLIDAQTKLNLLDCLRNSLEDACRRLADKFGLYDEAGRPRIAYITDVLTRYTCPSCAFQALTQTPEPVEVDAIFREIHNLAVMLLAQALRSLRQRHLNIQDEVEGEYGRLDLLVYRLRGSLLLVQSACSEVIVEVKTNLGFSLKQVLRYLIEKPNATAIIWRVRKRQILAIDGEKHRWLIMSFTASALQQALTILNGEFTPCKHKKPKNRPAELQNPQDMLDDFLTGLIEDLPKVVSAVMQIIEAKKKTSITCEGAVSTPQSESKQR